MLTGTRLEDDLADLLWSFVNLFHRKIDRIERELDSNEQAQRRGQAEQDGSEVKSVELERLIDQGISLIERRNAFEFFRDHAAELFEAATGSAWRPRAGSMVNHRALTASMIDSREFLAARRRADTEVLAPAGTRIAFTGGIDCNDHTRIWDALDKVRAKHPDMVLLHGGSPRGAERIAACWADNRKVAQVVFKPDWTRAPQRRALQAQRPDARSAADRRRRLPRLRHLRQPRRQGPKTRHPGVALRRRTAHRRRPSLRLFRGRRAATRRADRARVVILCGVSTGPAASPRASGLRHTLSRPVKSTGSRPRPPGLRQFRTAPFAPHYALRSRPSAGLARFSVDLHSAGRARSVAGQHRWIRVCRSGRTEIARHLAA